MSKRILKIVLLFLALVPSYIFSESWVVCLGSFKNQDNANKRLELLQRNGFPVEIYQHNATGSQPLYRVILSEEYQTKEMANFHKYLLWENETIKRLGIDDAWCFSKNATSVSAITNEKRVIVIRDSDTGTPVSEANVNIDRRWDLLTTTEGKIQVPDEVTDGDHSIIVSKGTEYVQTTGSLVLAGGQVASVPQVAIPKAVDFDRIKIILEWGEYPSDLDSHIVCGERHVYYGNKKSGNLDLDRDDTSSYGPETTTIENPVAADTYSYYIFNYSDRGENESSRLSNSGAQVKVYFNNEYKTAFNIRTNQNGLLWHVFDIVNNEIVPKDAISNEVSKIGRDY